MGDFSSTSTCHIDKLTPLYDANNNVIGALVDYSVMGQSGSISRFYNQTLNLNSNQLTSWSNTVTAAKNILAAQLGIQA